MKFIKVSVLICAALMLSLSCGCSSATEQNSSVETPSETEVSAVTEAETEAETGTEATTEEATEAAKDEKSEEIDLSAYSTFEVTSDDLHDGVWDPDISNTSAGSNRSPQLQWEAVEGAGLYAIYMIDTTSPNWIHWKSISESETSFPAGSATDKEYVGPYPPPGTTHDYEIYVFALKAPLEKYKGQFDSSNPNLFISLKQLDADGGNIISYGHITGTFTREQ